MEDLIRRSDAIEAIKDNSFALGDDYLEINGYGAIDDIRALPSADRPQEWIPCSERVPSEFVDVLVCLADGTMDVVQLTDYLDIDGEPKWCHGTGYTLGGAILNSDVVAWMPLPKPYGDRKTEHRDCINCESADDCAKCRGFTDEPQTEREGE